MKLTGMMVAVVGLGLAASPWLVRAGTAPGLSDCIATALEVNPDLRSASARLDAARAAVKEAASAYYPQLGLVGSWTRTDNPPQAFFMSLNQRRASLEKDFNNPDDIENARGSIVAQWRLWDGGRSGADRKAAGLGARAAEYSLDTVRNDLVFQITRAYYGILQARGFVTVREEAVRSISENLRIATERFQAGGALKTDQLNLEVQLSQAREDLIRARNGLELAVAALNTSIGKPLLSLADVPSMSDRSDRSDQSADQDSRPELQAAQAQVEMARAMATRARREYMPTLSAFGSVDWDSERFSGAEQSYLAGAAIELNIFDGFRTRAGVARAAAGVVSAQAQADKLRDLLALDLTQARLNESEARERLDVSAKSTESATEALRITEERFRQGSADITELMAAQVGLTATRTRRVAAQYDILIAQADVARARGELSRIHKEERQ